MAATTAVILLAASFVAAAPDPIIETCSQPSTFGCPQVIKLLDPCGGGASNSSLQQDLIYTPTASLGGCQCNSAFYNAFSSCLACIKSQGESSPEIQNQQDWVKNCDSYGFNFTANPIANASNPSTGPNGSSSSSSGLSTGAIVGVVVGVVGVLALIGAALYFKNRKGKDPLERPYAANSGAGEYVAAATAAAPGTDAQNNNNYHNADYSDANNYYPDNQYQNQQYGDYNDYNNQPYQQSGYENNCSNNNYGGYGNDYQNGYYGNNNDMAMQPMEQSYIPPPPPPQAGSTSPSTAAAVAAAAAAVTSTPSPRPSDTFPQSLRSKPTAWNQPELTSGLIGTPNNDKAEFEEGEEVLEPPRSQTRFGRDSDDFTSRRSMTPPRPSYRDDFNRPSFEREPRLSGSDRGSVSGMGMARSGHDSTSAQDEDAYSGIEDSPEFARRRARAAELFSAESIRK
ncbi:hypothetical protein BG005_006829 [Podila minutissima]|nr:hypothetical protein BG005_006829 [Podila minutissima]